MRQPNHSPRHRTCSDAGVPRARPAAAKAILVALALAVVCASCKIDDRPRYGPPTTLEPGDAGPDDNALSLPAKPCESGETRACHVTLGEHLGVMTCLSGTEVCTGGVWSGCGASGEATLSSRPSHGPEGWPVHTTSLSDAGACNSPCDPSCVTYVETPDGGVTVPPVVMGTYFTGSHTDGIASSPPGFIKKGLKSPCATINDCQFDFHCVSGSCIPWKSQETIAGCNKPDLTVGFGCTSGGVPTIPVCNRGNVTAPAGVALYIFGGNSAQFPTCTPDKVPGICYTSSAIKPGKCVSVTGCPGLNGNGNKTIMANPPLVPSSGTPNPKWVDECYCGNNWGNWSGNSAACTTAQNYDTVPLVYTQRYYGGCPVGRHVLWGYFGWDTATPSDSNVRFDVHSASTIAGLAAAPRIKLGTAKAAAPSTQTCSILGPSPCPVDLYAKFGGPPGATNENLELVFTLNSSTDKASVPTLKSWQLTYSCAASE